MSVEAISWALNLAPVPRDRGGKRNPACKAALVGLANHAAPDGRDAFPSVKTLVRYTDLSERTVRTALDRLEADGIIRPCDPAVVAAKIKRADQRPQGWDLAMHLIRSDLDDDELAALETQFPGLTARARAAEPAVSGQADHGVQPLHPAADTPVDNVTDGVQPSQPASGTGCSHRSDGVQPFPQRGAAAAPEPSLEPSREPSAIRAYARERSRPPHGGGEAAEGAGEFFAALDPQWPLTDSQRHRLAPVVAAALADGWDPARLASFAGANSAGVRSPYAVLASRLSPSELPAPPPRAAAGPSRPPWCGHCDPETRFLLDEFGYSGHVPCPHCRPGRARLAAAVHDRAGEQSERP